MSYSNAATAVPQPHYASRPHTEPHRKQRTAEQTHRLFEDLCAIFVGNEILVQRVLEQNPTVINSNRLSDLIIQGLDGWGSSDRWSWTAAISICDGFVSCFFFKFIVCISDNITPGITRKLRYSSSFWDLFCFSTFAMNCFVRFILRMFAFMQLPNFTFFFFYW